MPEILLYTSPGCPDCAALKRWFAQNGVACTEYDLSRPGVADEAKRRHGVRVAPITVIDGRVFYGTFTDQRPKIEAALGNARAPRSTA
ncbi:glutaredoxin [bacterium BMS3Bbin12]|nr:glutaredoxin [bacterium BMS3Bbin12]GBE49627.1 glutaredoxin [bacterium BMS3Bbin13]HDK03091.1 glutaredoxin family protein [Gammaproteobacteria bacterium]